ncbi:MAG: hypothetical protein HOM55_08545 [Proteobacteria bacterium]|jgi:hypothetical protein|nr:hypothetical protein [Pseudomonadota bacterium]
MKLWKQLLVIVLAACSSKMVSAQEIGGNLMPGGLALVPIFSFDKPIVRFGLKRIALLDNQAEHGIWLGLVGIDLLTAPGNYLLTRNNSANEKSDDLITISVKPKEQKLRLSRTITSRIEEYLRNALAEDDDDDSALKLVGQWQEERFFSLPFVAPLMEGSMEQDAFGVYVRYPSGQLEPVDALIFRSTKVPAQVVAPSAGIIHKAEFIGDSGVAQIVIDHGQGMFSILKGEYDAEVGVGDAVESGEIVALFTAGILRGNDVSREISWQLVLNGDLVDPSQFLELELENYFQRLIPDAQNYFAAMAEPEANLALESDENAIDQATPGEQAVDQEDTTNSDPINRQE